MDLNLTEEQIMLRDSAKEFLAIECPRSLVRDMENSESGHDKDLWEKMADLGWMGLVLPEDYGGIGMTFQDMSIILEEMGAYLLPGPYFSTVVLCGQAIRDFGSESQKSEYLNQVATGEIVMALAMTETSGSYDANTTRMTFELDGDEFILNGTKMFVLDGQSADYFLVLARSKVEGGISDGETAFFIVDANASGIKSTPLHVMGIDKQSRVEFESVRIPQSNLVGEIGCGGEIAERLIVWGGIGKCLEAIGGAQVAMDMAVDYVKRRPAFGKRVGNFQVIQHYCANMLKDLETSRNLVYQAAWLISEDRYDDPKIYIAKAWINGAYRRITTLAHQCHGGISTIKEMDLHLYYKKAMINESLFGDTRFHWDRVSNYIDI
ncbi:MAG: hypothetical protein CL787_05625 [Chloroflexi bacterium]|nr:hypothetical protein [Chloroflexota bacterium]MQF99403.1 acyl-CoA dehydrogenase [SAR202 cluster bacterium]|tara:strand:- start:7075 stop:8211 length:1137 start_codon:yes stop_codon:yes gene_type:complete